MRRAHALSEASPAESVEVGLLGGGVLLQIVLSVFFGFVSPNRIEVWESIILLLMYFGYVVMMKYHLDLHRAICRTLGLEYKEPRHYEFLQHGIMNLLQDKLQLNVEVHMVMGLGGSQVPLCFPDQIARPRTARVSENRN